MNEQYQIMGSHKHREAGVRCLISFVPVLLTINDVLQTDTTGQQEFLQGIYDRIL